ncbi:MAG: L-seryl-tRNA(Sec) selenium transferase, partial [Chlorobia bacterium]|nr:L-seryl-tRNA(Sec) selenium transferase [Fimbriimonadaceae bacterium]
MEKLRDLPKVDELSRDPGLSEFPERIRVEAARAAIDHMRQSMLGGVHVDISRSAQVANLKAHDMMASNLRAAINMSGVILHTGLGRARLAPSVAEEISRVARDHAYLEFDVEEGSRGDRQSHVRDLLVQLTGAEDALVVNNAAAALVLALRTLAEGKNVLLSRGQMVEIGGSFRVPEIVKQSNCHLVEVGCTNKTHLPDYVVDADTGAILVCHRSNFEIVGFASEPSISELSALGVPLVDDMGTGCLVDLARFGLPKTKTLSDSVREGAHVAIGSGDKLLGGPQAGIIVGRRDLIQRMKNHPLARALRVDKLTLAGLSPTLRLYLAGRELEIPTMRYLSRTPAEVRKLARRLANAIGPTAYVEASESQVGGGSGPLATIWTPAALPSINSLPS